MFRLFFLSLCIDVAIGEMELPRQEEEQEKERWMDQYHSGEKEHVERTTESTSHISPKLLLKTTQVNIHYTKESSLFTYLFFAPLNSLVYPS